MKILDIHRIQIDPEVRTIEYVVKRVNNNKIIIPERVKWETDKQSKLIESILIGIPINPIFLAEKIDESIIVIDGVQRICSIIEYMDNKFKLCGLQLNPELNGLCFDDLTNKYQNRLYCTYLTLHTLHYKESESMLIEIRNRIG
jgi:uncharacterized protein with ParB-like and HNH nuclease domain